MTTQQLEKKTTGRKSKLTADLISKLTKYIADGNYQVTACRAVNISERALYNWIDKGVLDEENGQESLYLQLVQAIKRAESVAEVERVARIKQAGIGGGVSKRRVTTFKDGTETIEETFAQPQWLADMTHLERRHPDRWGRKDRTRVDVHETKEITITTVEVIKDYGPGHAQIVEGEARELPEGKGE